MGLGYTYLLHKMKRWAIYIYKKIYYIIIVCHIIFTYIHDMPCHAIIFRLHAICYCHYYYYTKDICTKDEKIKDIITYYTHIIILLL